MKRADSLAVLADAAHSIREGWTPIQFLRASSHGANAVREVRAWEKFSAEPHIDRPEFTGAAAAHLARLAVHAALAAVGLKTL